MGHANYADQVFTVQDMMTSGICNHLLADPCDRVRDAAQPASANMSSPCVANIYPAHKNPDVIAYAKKSLEDYPLVPKLLKEIRHRSFACVAVLINTNCYSKIGVEDFGLHPWCYHQEHVLHERV